MIRRLIGCWFFFEFEKREATRLRLYSITGQSLIDIPEDAIQNGKMIVQYGHLRQGIYILEVIHDGKRFVKKYWLMP